MLKYADILVTFTDKIVTCSNGAGFAYIIVVYLDNLSSIGDHVFLAGLAQAVGVGAIAHRLGEILG